MWIADEQPFLTPPKTSPPRTVSLLPLLETAQGRHVVGKGTPKETVAQTLAIDLQRLRVSLSCCNESQSKLVLKWSIHNHVKN